jgi:hypothetical protein
LLVGLEVLSCKEKEEKKTIFWKRSLLSLQIMLFVFLWSWSKYIMHIWKCHNEHSHFVQFKIYANKKVRCICFLFLHNKLYKLVASSTVLECRQNSFPALMSLQPWGYLEWMPDPDLEIQVSICTNSGKSLVFTTTKKKITRALILSRAFCAHGWKQCPLVGL